MLFPVVVCDEQLLCNGNWVERLPNAALLQIAIARAGDGHPLGGALFAVGESGGTGLRPMRPPEGRGRRKTGAEAVGSIGRRSWPARLLGFKRCADETSEIPLDRTGAGVLEVRPDEAPAGLEDIFLVGIAMQGLLGEAKRGDFG